MCLRRESEQGVTGRMHGAAGAGGGSQLPGLAAGDVGEHGGGVEKEDDGEDGDCDGRGEMRRGCRHCCGGGGGGAGGRCGAAGA